MVLSTARTNTGYGPNPIAISEIFHVADHLFVEREEGLAYWQSMDRVWMEEATKKLKAQADAAKKKK